MRRPRLAFTLLEVVVAGALFSLVLGVAWQFFTAAGRQSQQLDGYAALIQGATLVQARLDGDISAMALPSNPTPESPLFERVPDGASLGFLRRRRIDSLEDVSPSGVELYRVRWRSEPRPDGTASLVREGDGGALQRFPGVACRNLRFELTLVGYDLYLVAEVELLAAVEPGATGPGAPRRVLPLRLVRRLVPPEHLYEGAAAPFPDDLLGPLPADEADS